MVSEACVRFPVVKNRPFMPGMVTVAVLAWLPISTLPANWAVPSNLTAVASGKFHSSRSRRPSGNWLMYVSMVRVPPRTLTRTVASAGILSKRMPCWPPLADSRSKSTLKTWSFDVPSPVKTVSVLLFLAVPVGVREAPSTYA